MRASILALSAAALVCTSLSAAAATRSVIITPGQMGSPDPGFVSLLDGVTTSVDIPINFPGDFKKNSAAKLIVKYVTSTTPCTIRLGLALAIRARKDRVAVLGTAAQMGVSNGAPLSLTLPQLTMKTVTHTVTGINTGTVTGQRKGDLIGITVQRLGGDALDTCTGDVNIISADFRYLTP